TSSNKKQRPEPCHAEARKQANSRHKRHVVAFVKPIDSHHQSSGPECKDGRPRSELCASSSSAHRCQHKESMLKALNQGSGKLFFQPDNIAIPIGIPEVHKTVRNNPRNSSKKLREISREAREHQLDFCYVNCSIRVSQFYEVVIPKHC